MEVSSHKFNNFKGITSSEMDNTVLTKKVYNLN